METLTTSNGHYTVKSKRKIRPRVLKSDYDLLQRKYNILSWITWAGWIAFIVTLKFAI